MSETEEKLDTLSVPPRAAIRRIVPVEHEIGEIRDRIAECGKLPIEHGEDTIGVLFDDQIVEPVIAVDDRAFVLRRDHEIGSLEVGKLADLAVLDNDPYAVAPSALRDIAVKGTILSGKPHSPND